MHKQIPEMQTLENTGGSRSRWSHGQATSGTPSCSCFSPNLELRTPLSACSTAFKPTWTSLPALWGSYFLSWCIQHHLSSSTMKWTMKCWFRYCWFLIVGVFFFNNCYYILLYINNCYYARTQTHTHTYTYHILIWRQKKHHDTDS